MLFDHLVVVENGFGMQISALAADAITRIENSSISRNGQSGIGVVSGVNSRLMVENCELSGNLSAGVVGGPGSSFVNNRISSNGSVGVVCNPAGTAVCALGRNSFLRQRHRRRESAVQYSGAARHGRQCLHG